MFIIAKRNIKLFFRDKTAVFFSIFAVFIMITLYVLFLGDNLLKGFEEGVEDTNGINVLLNSWLLAGILSITPITTTMGAFQIMINDRINHIIKDFLVVPIKRWYLISGYVLSAFSIGFIMSFITLILSQAYLVLSGGELLSALNFLKMIMLIIITGLTSSAMIFFMVSLFKSHHAFSTASSIIGTLIGFLTGIYLPIGSLPNSVQTVIKLFPISHASSLMRQVFMEQPMATSFAGASTEVIESFKLELGVVYQLGGYQISPAVSLLILWVSTLVFFSLSLLVFSRKGN